MLFGRLFEGRSRRFVAFGVVILVAFCLGYMMRGGGGEGRDAGHVHADTEDSATSWTCSMHPQIQLPKPGKCPICLMDLIPVETGAVDAEASPRRLVMTPAARKLAEVQTVAVERRVAQADVRMVGKVDYDETRMVHLSAWVAGRLDRLYVDYTGIQVRKGDHMVYMYSPELLASQTELLEALRATERLKRSDQPQMQETARQTVQAARDKLRLWGLTNEQIEEIETRGAPSDHMTIFAPKGGIVVEKHATEGMYVDVGTRIYTIADLSRVWVLLDAYESDMSWIRYGQEVEFETEAYPGEMFRGRITFIDPVLNAQTRTVKVRVNVENSDHRLKPEMFVRAVVHAHVASGGRVMDPQLSGKWICPMHPEVVESGPGQCRECGMQLVTAESLGYANIDESQPDLMVPVSAVLITGKRAVVYVEVPETEQPTYEGREVVLGPRAGDSYQVKSGLQAGEHVVVNGAFKIDSALQIQARPSMMNPDGGGSAGHTGHGAHGRSSAARAFAPRAFTENLAPVFASYFELQQALAGDDFAAAIAAFGRLRASVGSVDAATLTGSSRAEWTQLAGEVDEAAKRGASSADIARARHGFADVSTVVLAMEEHFGHPGTETHYRVHCPMAFDNQGADWLQTSNTVSNPYFGAAMARCGDVKEQFAPGEAAEASATP